MKVRELSPANSAQNAGLRRFAGASLFALAAYLAAGPALAQSTDTPPPVASSLDGNGIDLIGGGFYFTDTQVSVGSPNFGGLSRIYTGGPSSVVFASYDNLSGTINSSGSTYTVSLGNSSRSYSLSGSSFTSLQGDGSTLVKTNSTTYTQVLRDGSVAVYSTSYTGGIGVTANVAKITTLTRPNGEVDTWNYTFHQYQITPPTYFGGWRIESVTNNLGFQIKYLYRTTSGSITDFFLSQVVAINSAVDYCAPTATSCAGLTVTWPSISFDSSNANKVTDNLGRSTTYSSPAPSSTTTFVKPSGETITLVYDSSARVTSYSNGTGTWTYAYSNSGSTQTTTVTDPNGHTRVLVSDTSLLQVKSVTDGLSHTTSYLYDSFSRPTKITYPEGDSLSYTYDGRGNITQATKTGKDGVSTISTTASYDTTCANVFKCNRPNWTKDSNGNETDYTYDAGTGLATSVVSPAGANGLRPEVDQSYTSKYAYYKNSAGSIVAAASPITLPYQMNRCATAQTCVGSASDTLSTVGYGSAGVPNNLLPVSATSGAGDGSLSATALISYDSVGNVLNVTDALGNTTRLRYDAVRQLVGEVGPDPDGSGPLNNRAERFTYECDGTVASGCDGLVTLAEQGTVAGQSDSAWASFSSLGQVATSYDSVDRKTKVTTTNGSTTIGLVQYSYDNANRPTCTAVRMNPATYGSLPSSACTLATAGSSGSDRVTSLSYDSADRLISSTSAYGTTSAANDVVNTYGNDNELTNQSDAKNNLTTYVLDTFNRVLKVQFPSPTTAGTSSTTDYEQYAYDGNSNVTQDRRRDGFTITYGYDANNLVTSGYNGATYGYDNLGRQIKAVYGGLTTTFAYDALSRQTVENGPLGTVSRSFDLAGNETRLTYPDGWYVTYGYDATGALTSITDSSSVLLISATYDNLGRSASVGRQLGPTSSYSYGSDLRLSGLGYTFADATKNVTFGYAYNPAGQLLSTSLSNSLYYAPAVGGGAGTYTVDGQNKYAAGAGGAIGNDSRGNISSLGSTAYSYDELNRLTLGAGASLSYDGTGRLFQTSGSSTTRFLYDGTQIVGEYDGSNNLLHRYVPAPGLDEPMVWYDGAATSSANARWPLPDAQGSITAVGTTGTSNTTSAINAYDAFGIGASANVGRFQFKGMPWIPETRLYHVRARAYSPAIGRFMQSDPIGYGDGMNFYNFTHGDAVNGSDPTGLMCVLIGPNTYECPPGESPPPTTGPDIDVTPPPPSNTNPPSTIPDTIETLPTPRVIPAAWSLPKTTDPQMGAYVPYCVTVLPGYSAKISTAGGLSIKPSSGNGKLAGSKTLTNPAAPGGNVYLFFLDTPQSVLGVAPLRGTSGKGFVITITDPGSTQNVNASEGSYSILNYGNPNMGTGVSATVCGH